MNSRLKRQIKNLAGIPPCVSCLLGARVLGRVWIPAVTKKQLKKTGERSALYARIQLLLLQICVVGVVV